MSTQAFLFLWVTVNGEEVERGGNTSLIVSQQIKHPISTTGQVPAISESLTGAHAPAPNISSI